MAIPTIKQLLNGYKSEEEINFINEVTFNEDALIDHCQFIKRGI